MAALSTGHMAVDFAGGVLPALLPFIAEEYDLSYAYVGLLILASALASSIVPAAVRLLVRPARGDLAPTCGSCRRRHRHGACGVVAHVLVDRAVRDRLGPRYRRLPPRRIEVRRLCERDAACERDVALLDRWQPRLFARRDRDDADRRAPRGERRGVRGSAVPSRGGDAPVARAVPTRVRPAEASTRNAG